MNDNDIRKCIKNGYHWCSALNTIAKIRNGISGHWKHARVCHATRAAAQAAIDERKRLARIAEYRKSMEPITPEQAKDLSGVEPIFAIVLQTIVEHRMDGNDIPHNIGLGVYFWTREAAVAALAKLKACVDLIDADDDVYEFDGHRNEYFGKVHSVCPQMVGVPRETCGKDIRSTKNRLRGSKQKSVESHETPVGETQAKEVVTDETQTPKPTTVRGWLETIPDPAIRAAAIRQCSDWNRNCTGLAKAIVEIWSWFVTEEGPRFWFRCHNAAKGADTWPAYPPKAKQEADGWTQEEIEKAAFKPREWTDILQHVVSRDPSSKYHRTIHGVSEGTATVDVYNVLEAFSVTCPACQHAIKKLLCAGLRGKGSRLQDLAEAATSIARAIELEKQRGEGA